MIARRVSAIVLAPADSRALVGVAKKAADAGIVVVNIDNRLDRDALADRHLAVPFVGPDNRKGAAAVGAYVAKRLKAGDPIAILEGAPNAFNGIERKRGFEDAARAGGLTVARSHTAQWETARANQIVSALVSERADVKAILCANDSMALGAVAALKAAGRGRDILVAGFDNITAVQGLVKSGDIIATADQHGDQLAVYGIEFALERLRTPSAPLADRETPVDLITAETLH
jgi:ribose transport system substrate-binding protein